jgi:SPP1 family predicted phage head-tail adaptor
MAACTLSDLRHVVEIQSESASGDGGGGQTGPWASPAIVATVRARVEPLRGDERPRAMQIEAALTHRVTIRHRPDVTARMRLIFDTRIFNIRAVIDVQEQGRFLDLMCEEGVAT